MTARVGGGNRLLTSYANIVRLWRVGDGVMLKALSGHTDVPWTVAFSPDSQHIASVGVDATTTIWTVQDGVRERTRAGVGLTRPDRSVAARAVPAGRPGRAARGSVARGAGARVRTAWRACRGAEPCAWPAREGPPG